MSVTAKLIQGVMPGEYIRYRGRWVQVEMVEPGILGGTWMIYHGDGVVMLAHNTRVAVTQPPEETNTVEIVWPTLALPSG